MEWRYLTDRAYLKTVRDTIDILAIPDPELQLGELLLKSRDYEHYKLTSEKPLDVDQWSCFEKHSRV